MKPGNSTAFARRSRGFVLLEIMLAVALFATGVIALGWSVTHCLTAEAVKNDDQRARMALENRMAEIETGSVQIARDETEELKGMFSGITLKQSRRALDLENEKKEKLAGLWEVQLEATWESDGQSQSKVIRFFMFSDQ